MPSLGSSSTATSGRPAGRAQPGSTGAPPGIRATPLRKRIGGVRLDQDHRRAGQDPASRARPGGLDVHTHRRRLHPGPPAQAARRHDVDARIPAAVWATNPNPRALRPNQPNPRVFQQLRCELFVCRAGCRAAHSRSACGRALRMPVRSSAPVAGAAERHLVHRPLPYAGQILEISNVDGANRGPPRSACGPTAPARRNSA